MLIPWSGFEPEMVISNPFVQPLWLLPIRGVSSPPLLSRTTLFLLHLGVVSLW